MESLPQEILSAWKQITSKTLAAESSVQGSSVKQTWVWKTEGKTRTFRLFSAFPSLTGVVWHSPVEKLLFTFR